MSSFRERLRAVLTRPGFRKGDPREPISFDSFIDLGHGLYAETVLLTTDGPRPIARVAVGDRVLTFDHGPQPVRHIERVEFSWLRTEVPEALWPLRLPPGLFGNTEERFVAPQQALLLESDIAEEDYGDPFVLIPANVLALIPQVERVKPSSERVIFRPRFDRPELVLTEDGAVMLCDTGSMIDDWGFYDDDDAPLSYTTLPEDFAVDLLKREIARDGGIEAHIAKHLSRFEKFREAG
ncbi:Hint domain-containing protein [Rhodobacter xanthinilyticus]|uniref:Hint domain-containing protein n=1 Tax=Rhodobacter xanthinilyticus TaxID=1850250 RepID=UPI0009F54D7A|nr:Hint domain-containing protein [Rhodobacter xanthinilyticus]